MTISSLGLWTLRSRSLDCVVPTIDLEGPNAIATITGPTGAATTGGRLIYAFDFSGNKYVGLIGAISIENPTPEIEYTSGTTPATTFTHYSHVPDFVTTLKYVDGTPPVGTTPMVEYWHVQLGSVKRELLPGEWQPHDRRFGIWLGRAVERRVHGLSASGVWAE